MKTRIAFCALCAVVSGCLSVCRIPFPVQSDYSDEGECTNRVWRSMITDVRIRGYENHITNSCFRCYYPTIVMRCNVWDSLYGNPSDTILKGEDLYKAKWQKRLGWFPIGILWLTSPFDAFVDTLMSPYDYYFFNNEDK
jgi:uncharacterized protein YceK